MWIHIVDVSLSKRNGAFVWIPKSHLEQRSPKTEQNQPNAEDGWLTKDASTYEPKETWTTTIFKLGDIALFGMNLLHMTIPNLSE